MAWHWGRWSQWPFNRSHIHLKTGVSTAHAGVSSNISGLHICGADAVVIQAEGKAAASLRLRLRAVPSTPTRRICGCCEHPQSTGRRCRMCDGARILGREGVWGGGSRWGGGRRGERHRAEGAVLILVIHDRRFTRWNGCPGLPSWRHRAGLHQLRSPICFTLRTTRCRGRIVTPIARRSTFKRKTLQLKRQKHPRCQS